MAASRAIPTRCGWRSAHSRGPLKGSGNATYFLAVPEEFVADNVEPVLLTRRVAIKTDALPFDTPIGAFTSSDEQLAVGAKLEAEPFALPFRSYQRLFVQGARSARAFGGLCCRQIGLLGRRLQS